MKKLLLLFAFLYATVSHAADPLKIYSFQVQIITPEADVNIVTLQTRHNGDPEKVKLSYVVKGDGVSVKKYDNYDILDMGNALTASVTVIASDGVTEARSSYIYTRADVNINGYYQDRELWTNVTKNFGFVKAAFSFVEADSKLPNVLIIGNSISIGYTPYVRKNLEGVANVYRIPENGGSTDKAMTSIDFWLSDVKWDVIHVNWGLHDLKYTLSDEHQDVPLDRYAENLRALLSKIEKTGAKIIWAQTSFVPSDVKPRRDMGDDAKYNEVAKKVVKEFKNIVIDDQYKITKNNPENQLPHNVHFSPKGYEQQAEQATNYILKALK